MFLLFLPKNVKSIKNLKFMQRTVKIMGHNHLLEIWLLETGFLILFQPNP